MDLKMSCVGITPIANQVEENPNSFNLTHAIDSPFPSPCLDMEASIKEDNICSKLKILNQNFPYAFSFASKKRSQDSGKAEVQEESRFFEDLVTRVTEAFEVAMNEAWIPMSSFD